VRGTAGAAIAAASIVLATLGAGGRAPARDAALDLDQSRYMADLKFLASDELQGRGNGTPGLLRAGAFVADRFREAKLRPAGVAGDFFQPFAAGDKVVGTPTGSLVFLARDGRSTQLALGRDYVPASLGPAPPDTALPLVFAGYGIVAPTLGYDDYAGIDVKGKAVLVFTHEPSERDANSRFDGTALTQHGSVFQKALVARVRGAALLMVVTDPAHDLEDLDKSPWNTARETEFDGITVLRISRTELRHVFGDALDFERVGRQIDASARPASESLTGFSVRLHQQIDVQTMPLRNVIGVLEGADPAHRNEFLLVAAHYDHLGTGDRHSLAPGSRDVHNGADDNASGTAAVIELARAASVERTRFARSIVFAAFAGEELGLLGSAYFTEHPAVPLDRVVAMLNLDMMGRPHGRILIGGIDVNPALAGELDAAHEGSPLAIERFKETEAVGSSDDAPFVLNGIPALTFFSGFHADYHRPSDDWEKIDAKGAIEVTRLAMRVLERLATPAGERGGPAGVKAGRSIIP
jgi:hypothetical protein